MRRVEAGRLVSPERVVMNVRIVSEVDGQRVSEIVRTWRHSTPWTWKNGRVAKQRAGRELLEPGLSAVGEFAFDRVVAVGRYGTRGGVR